MTEKIYKRSLTLLLQDKLSKIDCTIGVLKSFDRCIENFDREIKLLQEAKRIMQNKKAQRVDTIKDCYQQNLCGLN